MTRPGSLKQGLFPSMMGFPHLSKALDLDLAGNLGRMAREVSELLAAPLEIDFNLPADATKAADVRPGAPAEAPSCRR